MNFNLLSQTNDGIVFYSEVNFVIDGKTYICPVMKQLDGKLRLYITVEVFDSLCDDYEICYDSGLNYKYNNYSCYILLNNSSNITIKYYTNSNEARYSSVIIMDRRNVLMKKHFVVNYNDGLFDFLSSTYNVIKDCVTMTMHICSSYYENTNITPTERWSHNHVIEGTELNDLHCVLESIDITDKIELLKQVMKQHTIKSRSTEPLDEVDNTADAEGDYMNYFSHRNVVAEDIVDNELPDINDMSYYPIIEYIKDKYTLSTDSETEANRLSNLGIYGVLNLCDELLEYLNIDIVNELGIYIMFECTYIKHKYNIDEYDNSVIGVLKNQFNEPVIIDDNDIIITELSNSIPLNTNDFIISTNKNYSKIYFEEYMEREKNRTINIYSKKDEKIQYVDRIVKQTVLVPTFYQTIVDDTILRINKNRYNIGIDIFALDNILKDMTLYIIFDNVKFPEIGRDINNVIFEIDGNLINKEKGVVNIVDEDDNVVFTQNYIIE